MMTAAGLVPFTTIDFPGQLAAVIFLRGCPLRCPFCHNFMLQEESGEAGISWTEVDEFLKSRKKRLDGIVLSGGEPLKHKEIIDLINKIKESGYLIGINTSGVYPDRLQEVLPLIDWVGLDIKAPWKKYALLTGRENMEGVVQKSLDILNRSGLDFECRTTYDPRYLTKEDILTIAQDLSSRGVKNYAVQAYHPFEGEQNPPTNIAVQGFFKDTKLQEKIRCLFPNYTVRNG